MVDKKDEDYDLFDEGSLKPWDVVERFEGDPHKDKIEQTIQENNNAQKSGEEKMNEQPEKFLEPLRGTPSNSIDTAHMLISSSKLTSYMPELDKELKLANLNNEEKGAIWQFQGVWEDLLWLREHQNKRIAEFEVINGQGSYHKYNMEDAVMEKVENTFSSHDDPELFDSMATLRKSERIAVLSRGKQGFERMQQVSTIQTNINENKDQSETKPGFIQKISGGLKR